VEPLNRLRARELEGYWEKSLRAQRKLEEDYRRFQAEQPRELSVEEPDQICRDYARKFLAVIRGPKLRTVLGYFLGGVWAMFEIAGLRLTSAGGLAARLEGEIDFRIDLMTRKGLISAIHSIARMAGPDGDELGFRLAQVATIKREQ
jgi:hypothetical protein